ncbi:anti-sigma factor [Achromobacter xylosoxidans]|uniref:anti-sigma factor n=1 Tax=Alcaligenes xylosoxydans xylosoxydans TaxID=85698 RepID=UPI0012A7FEA0|nr:anti-sigma factor [Achromobacter xylosoxidans]CUR67751.1 putative anti-sigmaE protein [Achromobacter xylosoxidans]
MNYRDPDLQDRLAAEYVLGGLRAGARRRFMQLMREDAALRRAVAEWEERLLPLALALPPEAPPPRVWQAVRARIATPRDAARSSWRGLTWWRTLSAGLAAAVVVLAFLTLTPTPSPREPQTIAVLAGDKTPALLVLNRVSDQRLAVQPMQDLTALADGRALELWAISPGQAPRSLGLLAPGAITFITPRQPPRQGDTVAVSLEPPGGAPQGVPTGPIVLSGKVI